MNYFVEHVVCNTEKQNDSIFGNKIILMQAVFINQAQFTGVKADSFAQDILIEITLYHIGQLQIVMGMELGGASRLVGKRVMEGLRRREHGCAKPVSRGEVPAQRKEPTFAKQRVGLYFLCGFGIFHADQTAAERVVLGEQRSILFCKLSA